MLELTFAVFLRTAWCAAILLVLVWIIQRLAGRWLSPRARYALWLLVAARLVILWTPASSLSLVGQLEHRITSAMSTEPSPKVKAEPLENIAYDPTDIDVDFHFDAFPREIALAPLDIKPELPTWQWSDLPIWSIVATIWLLGATLFGALLGRDFWRLRKAIRSMSPVSKPKLLELVRRIEKELLWNKPVRVLLSQDLASPAVTGVFAPALLLPALFVERLTEKELEHVIRHELTHVKRRDVLVNWLLAGIGAVYWFFPLMRYLLSQLRKTRELACDAAVLHSASTQERKSYGKTLLKIMEMVSEADRPALTFTVGVAGMVWNIGNARKESQMMRERLEIVVRDRTQRGRAGWLLGVMALMLIAVGFTEAQEKKPGIEEEEITLLTRARTQDAPVERVGFEFEQRLDAPLVQSYDLTNLAKLFEDPAIRGTKSANEAMRDWVGKVVRDSHWSNPKEVQIDWEGKTATIKHSAAGHARLLKAIKAFHTKPEHQFVLELSLASLSAEDFKKLDLDRLTNVRNEASRLSDPTSGATVQPQSAGETTLQRVVSQSFLLSNTELERAWVELSGLASFQRLQAPKVTTLNGEVANITVGNTRPFVTSIERIKGVDQPYVEVLFDGMQLESQAIALGDDQVWLRLQLQKSEVDADKLTTHKEGTVELQSPKVRSLSQITGVEMKDGQTLLMFIQTKGDDGKETVQAVTAKVYTIEPKPEGEAAPQPLPLKHSSSATGEEKLETVTYPIADLLIFKPRESDNEAAAAATRRRAKFELESFVAMFKENNPEFEKAPGRKIECDIDRLTVTLTGTPRDINCLKEEYYFRKLRMERAASKENPPAVTTPLLGLPIGEDGRPSKRAAAAIRNQELSKKKELEDASRAANTNTKVAYSLADLPMTKLLLLEVKEGEKPSKAQFGSVTTQITLLLARAIPGISSKKDLVLQPFYHNLTLEVTASPEDQEKIGDVMAFLKKMTTEDAAQQLEFNRIFADPNGRREGSSDQYGNILQVYEVHDQPLFDGLKGFIKDGDPKREQAIAQAEKLQLILRVEYPAFFEQKLGVELSVFPTNQTLVVNAPQDLHEKVKASLKQLSTMSPEECESKARRALNRKIGYVAPQADPQAATGAHSNRIGVEFNPPTTAMMRKHEKAIYSALEKIVDINFKNETLSKVLKVLGETTQINIVIDAAGLVEEGLKWNHPVSLQVKEPVSLKSALKLILDPLNLDYAVKDESLIITSKRLIEGQAIAVAYDVADLVIPIPLREFAKLSEDHKKKFITEDCFKEVLQRIFEENPDFLERMNKGFEVQPFPTNLTLVISGTSDDHDRISKRLAHLRRLKKKETSHSLKDANRTKADEFNEKIALEMKTKVINPSDMKGKTIAYDLSDFFRVCMPKSKGGKQSDGFDCGNPFTNVFAYLGQKLPELVAGEDTNEMQPFWTDKLLIVSTTPELQEKVAEYLKHLNKMSPEEAKQLIETNNVLADPSGQLLGRVDKSGNVLRAYRIDNDLIRKVSALSEKGQEPKQEVAIALQTLKSLTEGVIPAFVEKKPRAWIHDFASNQTLSVNAPEEDQEKVADLLKQLNRVPEEQLAKAVKESKSR